MPTIVNGCVKHHGALNLKDPKLVYSKSFEINWQQTYRGSSFHVGWMGNTLISNNPLSPNGGLQSQC